jgi:hypothetical protein
VGGAWWWPGPSSGAGSVPCARSWHQWATPNRDIPARECGVSVQPSKQKRARIGPVACRHWLAVSPAETLCALGQIRTADTRFRRAVLYPLSYEGGGNTRTVKSTHPQVAVGWLGRSGAVVDEATGRLGDALRAQRRCRWALRACLRAAVVLWVLFWPLQAAIGSVSVGGAVACEALRLARCRWMATPFCMMAHDSSLRWFQSGRALRPRPWTLRASDWWLSFSMVWRHPCGSA